MTFKNILLALVLSESWLVLEIVAQDDLRGALGPFQSANSLSTNSAKASVPNSAVLYATVKRFFEGRGSFSLDDLVVRSEVEELQAYFRRTRGHTRLSNPRLRKNVIPDNNLLARTFSSSEGQVFLRKVAQSLGGYERLNHLCISPMGRKILTEMVVSSDDHALVQYILDHEDRNARRLAQDQGHDQVHNDKIDIIGDQLINNRYTIYSIDDLLQALIQDLPSSG